MPHQTLHLRLTPKKSLNSTSTEEDMAAKNKKLQDLARAIFALSQIQDRMPLSTVRILLTIAIHEDNNPNSEGMHIEAIADAVGVKDASLVGRWIKALSTPDDSDLDEAGDMRVGKRLSERGLLRKTLGPRGMTFVKLSPKGRIMIDRVTRGGI